MIKLRRVFISADSCTGEYYNGESGIILSKIKIKIDDFMKAPKNKKKQ